MNSKAETIVRLKYVVGSLFWEPLLLLPHLFSFFRLFFNLLLLLSPFGILFPCTAILIPFLLPNDDSALQLINTPRDGLMREGEVGSNSEAKTIDEGTILSPISHAFICVLFSHISLCCFDLDRLASVWWWDCNDDTWLADSNFT